jgi:hypothetical protein
MSLVNPFFNIRSTKRSNPEARTTLDTLHSIQVKKMYDNENSLEYLEDEKKTVLSLLKETSIDNPALLDQLETKYKNLNNEINQRKNKNEFLDYFLETGDILYNYYDMQEKIQNGDLPMKQNSKRKPGSILDVLDKASDNIKVDIVKTNDNKPTNHLSRDKLCHDFQMGDLLQINKMIQELLNIYD